MRARGSSLAVEHMKEMRILVTGANGYVGGRSCHNCSPGSCVRCIVRDRRGSRGAHGPRRWRSSGDVLDAASRAVLAGMTSPTTSCTASARADFYDRDVAPPARSARPPGRRRRPHRLPGRPGRCDRRALGASALAPRRRRHLGESGVPVTEFRAAVIVGSGSVSFEMIRYLTERVPVMVCPNWVFTSIQPIAIRDVLAYLTEAVDTPACTGQDDRDRRQRRAHLRRDDARVCRRARAHALAAPGAVPDAPAVVVLGAPGHAHPGGDSRPLIEGLRNEVIVRDPRAREWFPTIAPAGYSSPCAGRSPASTARASRPRGRMRSRRAVPLRTRSCSRRRTAGARAPSDHRDRRAAARLRGVQFARRRHRLVPHELGVAAARHPRPARGRRRHAARPPRIRVTCGWATRWTSGGSRRSSQAGWCVCAPR